MSKEFNKIRDGSFLCVNEEGKAEWGQPEGYPYKVKELSVTFSKLNEYVEATLYTDIQYIVEIDGVEYKTSLEQKYYGPMGNTCFLGTAAWEVASTPNMPFSIYTRGSTSEVSGVMKRYNFHHADDKDHDVKVYVYDVIPMDSEFLPELTLTSPNGTKYAVSVSDEGTLSTAAIQA